MNKCKLKACCFALAAIFITGGLFSAGVANFSVLAEDEETPEVKPERFEAVNSLRESAERNGWSVGVFTGDELSPVETGAVADYTYYTTQSWTGYKYAANDNAFAYVPDGYEYTVADVFVGDRDKYLASEQYSFVLKNDADKDMALVYTAEKAGTLYFQDLAQVAPLHFDEKDKAGVFGEYRILLQSGGQTTQVYPQEGSHELQADNKVPVTSAWVNSSVEVEAGDKLIFRSDKADSTIFSSPVVSYEEFEETYELKNFWKFQQVVDANYFVPSYRIDPTGAWMTIGELETKGGETDIFQRGETSLKGVKLWSKEYQYLSMFGGMFVHASGNSSTEGADAGKGDIAYAFKVPHNGYVNLSLDIVGEWRANDYEIVYEGNVLAAAAEVAAEHTEFNGAGDMIFKNGLTMSANTVKVTAGTYIYFVQKTEGGGSIKADMNPVVTYVDAPYTLDKISLEIGTEEEETLTLQINPEYGIADDAEITWTSANEGIVQLVPVGNTLKVTGLAPGQTVISAKIGDYDAVSCEVTVEKVLRNEFTVSPEELSVKKGESGIFTVTVSDKISAEDLEIAVEDDTIATASLSGTTITVTGVKKGTTKLYITAEGSKSVTVSITVTEENKTEDSSDGTASVSSSGEEKGGCGSVIGLGSVATISAIGAAIVLFRKKK